MLWVMAKFLIKTIWLWPYGMTLDCSQKFLAVLPWSCMWESNGAFGAKTIQLQFMFGFSHRMNLLNTCVTSTQNSHYSQLFNSNRIKILATGINCNVHYKTLLITSFYPTNSTTWYIITKNTQFCEILLCSIITLFQELLAHPPGPEKIWSS